METPSALPFHVPLEGLEPAEVAALTAALDEVQSSAFVIWPDGSVALANAAGRAAIELAPKRVAAGLLASLAGRDDTFRVRRIVYPGAPSHYLAVQREKGEEPKTRVAAAADGPIGGSLPGQGERVFDSEPELTGATHSMECVRRSVRAVAQHKRSVVVTGETGTGKEIVARMLHWGSGRAGPFLAVNCGGFTDGLLASELFGHVRGAFTGAVSDQKGLFRAADGGTLFLDEAGDIPLRLQVVLLRVLETRRVRPVGSCRDVEVDVRVVASFNRSVPTLVREGIFRADLYARLAQWVIQLPPLRDRLEDTPALTRALLAQIGEPRRTLTPDLEAALLAHPWPLNVRGLLNVLSIAAIATPAGQPLELGPEVQTSMDDMVRAMAVTQERAPVELDRPSLEDLLRRHAGHVAESARQAGVSRSRMYRMLWSAGLDPSQFRDRPELDAAAS